MPNSEVRYFIVDGNLFEMTDNWTILMSFLYCAAKSTTFLLCGCRDRDDGVLRVVEIEWASVRPR